MMLVGHITALFTVTVWGITFISTKVLLPFLAPEEILFIRFLLGWLALWIISGRLLKFQGRKIEAAFMAAGFFGVTLYFLLENIALTYTYASNVGVIVSSAPFFTALADWVFFGGAKPGIRFYSGFVLAMSGIAIISFTGTEIRINPTGDLLALLAAIAWAFYSGFTKKLADLNLGSIIITRRIFFYGLLLMLPVLLLTGFPLELSVLLKPEILGNLIFLGLGASALCFVTWTFCLNRLGTARASAYIYLVPVITVMAAAIWLDERISLPMVTGMILVIMGLLLSETRLGHRQRIAEMAHPNIQ